MIRAAACKRDAEYGGSLEGDVLALADLAAAPGTGRRREAKRPAASEKGKGKEAVTEQSETAGSGSAGVPAEDLHAHPNLAFGMGLAVGLALHAAGDEAKGQLRKVARIE